MSTVDTEVLNINQSITDIRWDVFKKHNDISMSNLSTTARLVSRKSGTKACLATTGYLLGTDIGELVYNIYNGASIQVGLATSSRDLTTLTAGSDLISHDISGVIDTTLNMSINLTTVVITYQGVSTVIDITGSAGLTMYPWLSDNGSGFTVGIAQVSKLTVSVATDGSVVFNTVVAGTEKEIKFETGQATVTFSGPVTITDQTVTTLQVGPDANVTDSIVSFSSSGGNKGIMLPLVSSAAAVATPEAGMLIYDKSVEIAKVYNGTVWKDLYA